MTTPTPILLGVDTGGTFTDFVLFREGTLRVHKVLSTPAAPELAILQGIQELGLHQPEQLARLTLVHGSTVATNAVLEGKGVRTVYITNRGLADVLTIGRQARDELYNLQPAPMSAPVPSELCLETGGRLSAQGELIDPLSSDDLATLRAQLERLQPEAVAINLLFSFLDDQYERAIADIVPEGIFVSRSSAILPEYREYERGIATWLNAWVGPLMQRYLSRLHQALPGARIAVMQSCGGTVAIEQAAQRAVNLLLSGPAGGLAGAHYIGNLSNRDCLLTFDMGGTSTDVALVDQQIVLTSEGRIGRYPIAVPMIDMHTIGAGGGSIAYLDDGGMLRVGPASAGAHPGPACYGRGGQHPTVTDANVVLGRIPPEAFLGGQMTLDRAAAQQAFSTLGNQLGLSPDQTAAGVIALANEHMARALRVMSVQRGIDPRQLTLTSFGGAGGLHVCALAEALGMHSALVPVHGGVLSALGMLVAPRARQLSRSHIGLLAQQTNETLIRLLDELAQQGRQALQAEGVASEAIHADYSLDLRYRGQSYCLNIPWSTLEQAADTFQHSHEQRLGHRMHQPIELVNLRVRLHGPSLDFVLPKAQVVPASAAHTAALWGIDTPVPVWQRDALPPGQAINGPALLIDAVSTTYLAPGWRCERDGYGSLLLTHGLADQPDVA